jgi:SAM-dependent methyltransferase
VPDETRRSYDRVAARYRDDIADELRDKPLDRALLRAFAELVGDGPVVDLGAGPGHVAAALTALGPRVVALDLSPAMCRLAAATVDGRAVAGDLTALPLRPASVGGVVSLYAVIHLDTDARAGAYGEIARVLRPGGVALIAFHTRDTDHEPGTALTMSAWWDEPVSLTFRFLDPEAELAAMEAAGLALVARLDRAPNDRGEHPSHRSYLLARRPPGAG